MAYIVLAPAQTGPYSVIFTRRGRVFQTLEAATSAARRFNGKVQAYGTSNTVVDFSDGFEVQEVPDIGRRQTPAQALQAWGLR